MKMNLIKRFFLPFRILINNWELYKQLLRREVEMKYKGSYLGLLWNLITPIIMLAIYTFVFGMVFKARWDYSMSNSKVEFALTLFAGIIVYSLFSEALNRSTTLVSSNANYVKKVIFPLELLSIAHVSSLLIQVGISVIIIICGKLLFLQAFDLCFLLFPLGMIPLIFFSLGLSWLISAVGVFVKDMQQVVAIVVLVMGYMTPVFYPVSYVPEGLGWIMQINPLTYIVEFSRNVLIYGIIPNVGGYVVSFLSCYIVMMLGLSFFSKVKAEFADVL